MYIIEHINKHKQLTQARFGGYGVISLSLNYLREKCVIDFPRNIRGSNNTKKQQKKSLIQSISDPLKTFLPSEFMNMDVSYTKLLFLLHEPFPYTVHR